MSNKVIDINNVCFHYQEQKNASLTHVNLQINEGEVVVLCGESGCGKSTIIRLINGLIPYYYKGRMDGQVKVLGHLTQEGNIYNMGSKVSSVFQNPRSQFFCVDVKSELAFGAENLNYDKDEIIKRIEDASHELKFEYLLDRTMFQLSGGEKQKIACASVSITDNPIVVLDEPSSNLDMHAVTELKAMIRYWKQKGNGNIIDDPNIHVGDTLHFNHVQMNGLSSSIDNNFDCKVMAKVLINENTDTIRSTGFAKFYMPTDVFLPLCEQPHLVSFPFNVVDGMEADMEEFLSSYVEDIEPSMNYDSKQTYINSFNDLTSLIITIGGALSIIIGLIGITNFVNSVLTSIITRRKELAMLQSIGMTGKQLKKMLSFEGLYYAAGTVVASIVFGSLVSVIIVRAISNSIWFFTYKFVIFPMFVIYPFLIALTVIIPAIIYRKIAKTSIIERLHQN